MCLNKVQPRISIIAELYRHLLYTSGYNGESSMVTHNLVLDDVDTDTTITAFRAIIIQ